MRSLGKVTIVLQILKNIMDLEPNAILGVRLPDVEYIVREGAYAVIFDDARKDKVGLIKVQTDIFGEKYYLVGGGLEDCDHGDYLSTLKREIREETGYEVKDEKFLMRIDEYFHSPYMDGYFKKEGYFYIVTLGEKGIEKIEENHDLVWLDSEDAYEKVHHLCAKKVIKDFC